MLKDILVRIGEGGVATPLLAADLGISPVQLHERLKMMEHMGYLQRDPACTPVRPSLPCVCCSRCNTGDLPARYILTDKGRRVIRSPIKSR